MKNDANKIAPNAVLSAHICIVGGGAAGITIARELIGMGKKVILLEGGGYESSNASQELYDGTTIPANPLPKLLPPNYAEISRLRFFGGSTNHWGGWCRPLDSHDFEERPWVPLSGWPISRNDLLPFYSKASKVLTHEPFDFQNENRSTAKGYERMYEDLFRKPLANPEVMFRYFHFAQKLQLGELYKEELWEADNVEVITNANVLNFSCDSSGKRVEKVLVKGQSGAEFTVSADLFVLACGGLENPRILLNSNAQHSKGLGNSSDCVGRYFMEHPHVNLGYFLNLKGKEWAKPMYFSGDGPTTIFATTPEFQAKHKTLNFCATIDKSNKPPKGKEKIMELMEAMGASVPQSDYLFFYARTEMEPKAHNRVSLMPQRDRLGLRKLSISLTYSENDRISIKKSGQAVIRFLSYQGAGRGRLVTDNEDEWDPAVGYGHHHMGTTRMHSDPKKGTVDANCKMHDLANLYVGGSSVFPTGGYANPTLTLVALALRLAKHLKEKA